MLSQKTLFALAVAGLFALTPEAIQLEDCGCGCGGCCDDHDENNDDDDDGDQGEDDDQGDDENDDVVPNNDDDEDRDDELPSDFCCWFYKEDNFQFAEDEDKFVLCAKENFFGDLLPHAKSLMDNNANHFNDEMNSYKCGAKVSADLCGGHFTDIDILDPDTGAIIGEDHECSGAPMKLVEPGEQNPDYQFHDLMSSVIVRPILDD